MKNWPRINIFLAAFYYRGSHANRVDRFVRMRSVSFEIYLFVLWTNFRFLFVWFLRHLIRWTSSCSTSLCEHRSCKRRLLCVLWKRNNEKKEKFVSCHRCDGHFERMPVVNKIIEKKKVKTKKKMLKIRIFTIWIKLTQTVFVDQTKINLRRFFHHEKTLEPRPSASSSKFSSRFSLYEYKINFTSIDQDSTKTKRSFLTSWSKIFLQWNRTREELFGFQ